MNFSATKHSVSNRGVPPDSFLTELVEWAKNAHEDIFAPNAVPVDIFTVIKPNLATPAGADPSGTPIFHWDSFLHRKSAMLEAMRVHAGFESSWNWREGVDTTNEHSQAHIEGQETGIFQVSYDSIYLGGAAMKPFALSHGIGLVEDFIREMKEDHPLALEYYARLVRVSIAWAGPLKRHEINPYLRRDAMLEFQNLLS